MRGTVVVEDERDYQAWLEQAADLRAAVDAGSKQNRGRRSRTRAPAASCRRPRRRATRRAADTEGFDGRCHAWRGRAHPAAPKSTDVELYHPHSWWTKYVFCQDAKVIAIQYSLTALAIGLVALVLSWLMRLQLGFPGTFAFIDAEHYYQFITMHGMIMVIYLLTALFLGGFGNYLIPLMVGARDMVFPYVNMLSYWIYLLAVLVLVASFFVPGGPTGAGWTLYPPQAILSGTPGHEWGIILMLVSLDHLHHRLHHGRPELRRDGAAGAHAAA